MVETAFAIEPGVVSEPVADESVSTQGGYWLVRVIEKDVNRKLDDETREELTASAFDDWLNEQREKSSIEKYMDDKQKSWAIDRVLENRGG